MSIAGYRIQQYVNACSRFETHRQQVQETLDSYADALEFYARMSQTPYPTGLPGYESSPHVVWSVLQKL